MIGFSNDAGKLVEIVLPRKVGKGDFPTLAPLVDAVIEREGSIRLVLNLATFRGWTGFRAALEHLRFVQGHHQKVEQLAVVTGPAWQKLLIGLVHFLVHPGVKLFKADRVEAAREWVIQDKR